MRFFRILREVLSEIFEESAYERFCVRYGVARSTDSYGSFIRQEAATRSTRVKCC